MAASVVHSVSQPKSFLRAVTQTHSESLCASSLCSLRSEIQLPRLRKVSSHRRVVPVIVAFQSNIFRALQTALKIGRDGVDAGTNLVPDSIPRPIARIGVTGAAGFLALFVFRSILSTAFFALGTMGFVYFVYLALNKDKGGGGGGGPDIKSRGDPKSTGEAVEEARRIMDKYK